MRVIPDCYGTSRVPIWYPPPGINTLSIVLASGNER
jgi:hypothetical protein